MILRNWGSAVGIGRKEESVTIVCYSPDSDQKLGLVRLNKSVYYFTTPLFLSF